MIAITIYVVGYVVAYGMLKYMRNYKDENRNTWMDVMYSVLISSFSWGIVVIVGLLLVISKIDESETKPPKWL